MSVAIATRGMVRSCCQYDQIVSCDSPQLQSVLEVHPRIRGVAAPVVPTLAPPVVSETSNLRPSVSGAKAPLPPSPDPRPEPAATLELRPVIKKVEEE